MNVVSCSVQENNLTKERPPAWTQVAYRLRRIKYSICYPRWGTPPPPSRGTPGKVWLGGRGYLRWGTPWPGLTSGGYPRWGTPSRGNPPRLDLARVPPCGQTDGWMNGQTRVKILPSRRTTYTVGKNDVWTLVLVVQLEIFLLVSSNFLMISVHMDMSDRSVRNNVENRWLVDDQNIRQMRFQLVLIGLSGTMNQTDQFEYIFIELATRWKFLANSVPTNQFLLFFIDSIILLYKCTKYRKLC